MTLPPLVVDGAAPAVLPACPLPGDDREARPLFVMERTVHLRTRHGWERIPRGYVTDFASIPALATLVTGWRLQPLGRWAWAAIAHDWMYGIGQPGYRPVADDILHERMVLDRVGALSRVIIYDAVRIGGAGGYAKAPSWWDSENFADPETGAYPVTPPFTREEAFAGRTWGLRPQPDWPS